MILRHGGKNYFITNWDEFSEKLLWAIGFQIEAEALNQIRRMKLMGKKGAGGRLFGSYKANANKTELTIESDAPYAVYLEYGTFDYWRRFGLGNFPEPGYPAIPKKKELTAKQKEGMPKGGQPFAILRRILWNQNKMSQIITKAVKSTSR